MLIFTLFAARLGAAASPLDALLAVLSYVLFPAAAVVIGGAIALIRVPSPHTQSMIQHFAAGVVFAAVGVELLPDVLHLGNPLAVIIGFTLGILVMLGVQGLSSRLEPAEEPAGAPARPALLTPLLITRAPMTALPVGLLVAVAIDLGVVDGVLVGIGVAGSAKSGFLITLALTLEVLFLGLSTVVALRKAGVRPAGTLAASGGFALLLTASAVFTGLLLGGLTGGALEAVLAFGVAALLYLVTEELLVEAHEVPTTLLTTSSFFAGFLILLIITMITES